MVTLRKVLFWMHLVAGLVAGVVIFIMSLTGAAIALQPQLLLWAERAIRTVDPPGGKAWLGPEALLSKVREQRPGFVPTGLTLEHDPSLAAAVTLVPAPAPESDAAVTRGPDRSPGSSGPGGPPQTTVYVDPYTGAVLGELDPTSPARRFFRVNTDLHRWLALSGDQRSTGRWVTGVSNAAFLVLALTGLFIWVPRVWSWTAVRAVTFFRSGLSGKARDFNWHNVIGIWSSAVLVVLTFTGMCISFPKTYEAIYAVTGIEPPPASGRPGGGRAGARPTAPDAGSFDNLDRAWAKAEAQMPSWRSIAIRVAARPGEAVSFTFNDRNRLNPMARSTATVEGASAEVTRWEPYEQLPTGQRLRTWMRFGHTGELWGITGQIVAGLASLGGCVLVYTGFALAWRRWTAWRARRARTPAAGVREQPAA